MPTTTQKHKEYAYECAYVLSWNPRRVATSSYAQKPLTPHPTQACISKLPSLKTSMSKWTCSHVWLLDGHHPQLASNALKISYEGSVVSQSKQIPWEQAGRSGRPHTNTFSYHIFTVYPPITDILISYIHCISINLFSTVARHRWEWHWITSQRCCWYRYLQYSASHSGFLLRVLLVGKLSAVGVSCHSVTAFNLFLYSIQSVTVCFC